MTERIYLYDSTLRDGAQTHGVDFSSADKKAIAIALDDLGIDYIEGGWPGANPTDDAFFASPPKFKKSKLVAFGMTRKNGRSAGNDPSLAALINSGVKDFCIVGKAWDFQVTDSLGISLEENLSMVSETIEHMAKNGETSFDAEHFFDGYKKNPEYALSVIEAAHKAGSRWVVLCDTNGGTLPHEISAIINEVTKKIPGKFLGIHCHNDTENAVANSIAAVVAGVRQVQGTLGGLGERCGNCNLISMIPTLTLKMGFDVGIPFEKLKELTRVSRFLDERLNRPPNMRAAYVGTSAFAHKGGLHVSAVVKNPDAYEHINPETVGNQRLILVSDQAGRSNIIKSLKDVGIDVEGLESEKVSKLLDEIKERENRGYAYDSAPASFEVLARKMLGQVPEYYNLLNFRVIDERRWNAKGELITFSEAKVKLQDGNNEAMVVAEGNGPVDALNNCLIKVLSSKYAALSELRLVDFRVRIIEPERATAAITRVQIEHEDGDGNRFSTIGVSGNIIDAAYNALDDAFTYHLLKNGVRDENSGAGN